MADVDELELPELDDLFEYWAQSPPTHELVAAFMGVSPEPAVETSSTQEMSLEEMQLLVAQMNGLV